MHLNCKNCQRPAEAGARFCSSCGTGIRDSSPSAGEAQCPTGTRDKLTDKQTVAGTKSPQDALTRDRLLALTLVGVLAIGGVWFYQTRPVAQVSISPAKQEQAANQASAAVSPAGIRQPPRPSGNYVAAGAVICTDQRAFARVIAIERSNNPYIPLPDNCEHVGANVPVNVLRTSSFLGESLTLVGNSGGTVWVQSHNVR